MECEKLRSQNMAVCSYLAGSPAGESVAWGSHWHGRCKGLPLTSLHIFTAHRKYNKRAFRLGPQAFETLDLDPLNYTGSGMPVALRIFFARSKVPTEV